MINPIFIYYNPHSKKYIVQKSKYYDWIQHNTVWMRDSELGDGSFVPHIDIEELKESFDDELLAMRRVAELYAEQLNTE